MRYGIFSTNMRVMLGRYPLRHQLVLLVLATALPLVLATYLMFQQLVAHERANTRQSLLDDAKQLATLVDGEIDLHIAIARTLAQSPALQTGDLPAFWEEAKGALAYVPGAWLTVSTPEGQMLLSTRVPLGAPLPARTAMDVIDRAFANHQPELSGIVPDPASNPDFHLSGSCRLWLC